MSGFTQKVQTPEGCFDISFQELAAGQSSEYLVTVVEDDYAAPPFSMRFTNGCWKILNAAHVAFWIVQLEGVLQETILENLG